MRPTPPAAMQYQPYPMPYQQQIHANFPQYHVNPSFDYYYQSMVPGVPAQTFMMPPRLPPTTGHSMQHFTSEPEQYRPATAPPTQTIYYPNMGTPSTTSVRYSPSLLPSTTSTST